MSKLTGTFRRMSKLRDDIQRKVQFDKINISDDLRGTSLSKIIKARIVDKAIEVKRTSEAPAQETDLNIKAELTVSGIKLVSEADGQNANLISFEIVDGETLGAASVQVKKKRHIKLKVEAGVTDIDTAIAALQADSRVEALVEISLVGTGTDPVTLTEGKTFMDGR
jgi:hypothetical protein